MSPERWWMAAGLLAIAIPVALQAQDVKYTETSKVEAFMTLPGMGNPVKSTTYVSKGRVRTDNEEESTIMDYTGGTFTQMDHKAKTYFTMSFADLMANAGNMMADAKVQREQAEQQARQENPEQPELKLDFDVKVQRLGDGGRVSGYSTEHVVMVLEANATSTQPDPETGEEVSGTLIFVSDMWVAKDFPGFQALQEAQMAAASEASAEMRQQMEEMAEASKEMAASVPGIQGGGGLERTAEEMKKIEGTPVRSLTYQVMLPEGVELDLDAVLAMADKPLPSFSLGAAMGQAAKEGVKNAISGRLGGLLGRRREEPKPEDAPQATQAILVRVTTAIEEVSTEPLSDDLFRPAADYREVKPDWMGGGG